MDDETIGGRIKRLRSRLGLSQADLADRLGIRHQSVYRFESGRMKPSAETGIDLADIFGVSVRYLVRGEPGGSTEALARMDYPTFAQWLDEMAPRDITDEEKDILARIPFTNGPPAPWRYSAILDHMRSEPKHSSKPPTQSAADEAPAGNSRPKGSRSALN